MGKNKGFVLTTLAILLVIMCSFFVLAEKFNFNDIGLTLGFEETIYNEDGKIRINCSGANCTSSNNVQLTASDGNNYYLEIRDLAEGINYYELNATDQAGNPFENNPYRYLLDVDTVNPEFLSADPDPTEKFTTPDKKIELTFSEDIVLEDSEIEINGENITFNWSYVDGVAVRNIIEFPQDFDDGEYVINLKFTDKHNNTNTDYLIYDVDMPPQFRVVKPEFYEPDTIVSSQENFMLEIETDDPSEVRYKHFQSKTYSVPEFEAMTPLVSSANETTHSANSRFTEGTNYIFVKALRDDGVENSMRYELIVDKTAPEVTVTSSDVISLPLKTTIEISSNEPVFCKWDNTSRNFESMPNYVRGEDKRNISQYRTSVGVSVENLRDETDYTFNVACRNLAGLVTVESVSIKVNSKIEGRMKIVSPENFVGGSFVAKVETNMPSSCSYGENNTCVTTLLSGISGKEHYSGDIKLKSKPEAYEYLFCCSFVTSSGNYELKKKVEFKVDVTKPEMIIDLKQPNSDLDKLHTKNMMLINLNGTDEESGIDRYVYAVFKWNGTREGFDALKSTSKFDMLNKTNKTVVIKDWTETSKSSFYVDEDSHGNVLSLSSGDLIYVLAYAENRVHLLSDKKISRLLTVDLDNQEFYCSNGYYDEGLEIDIDCGLKCSPCEIGKDCLSHIDCSSLYCKDKKCTEATCSDGIKNQGEVDVDCGGPCNSCVAGKACQENYDCKSKYCFNGLCKADYCFNQIQDDDEADVDCGGVCNAKCVIGDSCSYDSDCVTDNCRAGTCDEEMDDSDDDGIEDSEDNCPNDANSDQSDIDGDGKGDVCDSDTDGDGIPNSWEERNNLDIYINDADGDSDDDGLSNYEEYINGTDPTVSDKKANWLVFLLLILFLTVIIAGVAILGYDYYKNGNVDLDRSLDNVKNLGKKDPKKNLEAKSGLNNKSPSTNKPGSNQQQNRNQQQKQISGQGRKPQGRSPPVRQSQNNQQARAPLGKQKQNNGSPVKQRPLPVPEDKSDIGRKDVFEELRKIAEDKKK